MYRTPRCPCKDLQIVTSTKAYWSGFGCQPIELLPQYAWRHSRSPGRADKQRFRFRGVKQEAGEGRGHHGVVLACLQEGRLFRQSAGAK